MFTNVSLCLPLSLFPSIFLLSASARCIYLVRVSLKNTCVQFAILETSCSSSRLHCTGVRLVSRHYAVRQLLLFFKLLLPVVVFSLHFSSSSAFHRSLFTQSSHLRYGLPHFCNLHNNNNNNNNIRCLELLSGKKLCSRVFIAGTFVIQTRHSINDDKR